MEKKNRSSGAVFLKIKSNKTRKKRREINNEKKNKKIIIHPVKDGIPTKDEFVDISLNCDCIFQYLFENKSINKRHYNFIFIFAYVTLILVHLHVLSFMVLTMYPSYCFPYQCFDPISQSYMPCSHRNWCLCEDPSKCLVMCYETEENCIDYFTNSSTHIGINSLLNSNIFGARLFIRVDSNGTTLNIFDRIESNICMVRDYVLYIICSFFIGGLFGNLIFGFLSERYGKKAILLSQSLFLNVSFIFVCVYSNKKFNEYDSITYFLCIWVINAFILGSCLFSMENLVYVQFMENYPNVSNLNTINGFFHSHFPFSGMLIFILCHFIKNLTYLYYFSICYFTAFFFGYLYYFPENPRFFSERRQNINKKHVFQRFLAKVLIQKKKEDGEEKFWKNIVFYDSTKQKIENDVIKEKVIEVDEDEVEYYLSQARNRNKNLSNINLNNINTFSNYDKKQSFIFSSQINERESKRRLVNDPGSLSENQLIEDKKVKNKKNSRVIGNNSQINNQRSLNYSQKTGRDGHSVKKGSKIKNKFDNQFGDSKITAKYIFEKCIEDEYLKKHFWILITGWVSISYCFWGTIMGFILRMVDPNSADLFHSPGFLIYMIIMCFAVPIAIGNISFYFSPDKLICICLFIFCVLSVTIDSAYLYPDFERTIYFGSSEQQKSYSGEPFSIVSASIFIIIVYSLFQLITIISAPTLYRTFFLSVCKSVSKFSAFLAYCTHYRSDCPGLNLGIIAIFSLFIFLLVDFKLKEIKLLEYCDSENKVNSDKEKKMTEFGLTLNLDGRKSRGNSIFTKLRNLSIRKLKKS
jgi:hypothetical protein